MRIYSQKELLNEGFSDLLKKVGRGTKKAIKGTASKIGKTMHAIDPKASENLLRPFKQTRDVYRAIIPGSTGAGESSSKNKEVGDFVSVSKDPGSKFLAKNSKVIQKIADTEKKLYNREIDPQSITTVNMKLPSGKAVKRFLILSKELNANPNVPVKRYLYSLDGKYLKRL